jgi:hypothetical protein
VYKREREREYLKYICSYILLRNNSHAAVGGPGAAHYAGHGSAAVVLAFVAALDLFDLLEAKDVLCEVIGLDLLLEGCLKVGVAHQ